MAPKAKTIQEKFNEHVCRTSSCWIWTGAKYKSGYGFINIHEGGKGRTLGAHRASWLIHNGAIPEGLLVCHSCDVRDCVNPEHLFLGTVADNAKDMVSKGRALFGNKNPTRKHPDRVARGERLPQAKLTEKDVIEIRAMYRAGLSQSEIASRFNVEQTNISAIVRGKSWKHLLEHAA